MKKCKDNPVSQLVHAHKLDINQFSLIADANHTVICRSLEGRHTCLPTCVRHGLEGSGADADRIERRCRTYRLSLRNRLLDGLHVKDAA